MHWSDPDESGFNKLHWLVWVLLTAIVIALWVINPKPIDFILSEEGPIEMIAALSYMFYGSALLLARKMACGLPAVHAGFV